MSTHEATLHWERDKADFTYATYTRTHRWTFGSGSSVDATAAPEFRGDPKLVNPEEAFVAAISSCHMLTFLAIAARGGWTVDTYDDHAVGTMAKNAAGRMAVTRAVLHPRIGFGGERRPDEAQIAKMHELSHEQCFIANSVATVITIE